MVDSSSYLGRVQVLRFLAASAVLFAHLQHEVQSHLADYSGYRPFTLIDGGFGVDLFFVISGFIMYHVSAKQFGEPGATANFLLRRFLRIAPLYYLATLMMLVSTFFFRDAVSIPQLDLGHVVSSFLFFPSVNALDQTVPVLKLGWTLNFEAYFYLVFGLALGFGRRAGLIAMMLTLSGIVVLAQILPQPPAALAFWGQSLVFEFIGGVGVAMLYHRAIQLRAAAATAIIVASLLLLAALRATELTSLLPRALYAGIPAWSIVFAVVCAPFDRRQGRVKRFLVAGGEASFAIYVIHPFGIRAGALAWDRLSLPPVPWLYVALLMILVIAAAFAVNRLVERPLDRWLRRWLDRTREPRRIAAMSKT